MEQFYVGIIDKGNEITYMISQVQPVESQITSHTPEGYDLEKRFEVAKGLIEERFGVTVCHGWALVTKNRVFELYEYDYDTPPDEWEGESNWNDTTYDNLNTSGSIGFSVSEG
jgi:hypothetical protein